MSVLGMVAALAAFEIGLRPFASSWRERPHTRPAEVRQFYEGVAVSHFGPDSERKTGNAVRLGAPNVLILGDSHVEALQVDDSETMGAVLERTARSQGQSINVHQYGWSSAGAALYADVAPHLLEKWDPVRVIITLNIGDIYQGFDNPLAVRTTANTFEVVHTRAAQPEGWRKSIAAPLLSNSVLIYHLYRVTRLMQEAADFPNGDLPSEVELDPSLKNVPLPLIKTLKSAYGHRLLVVYDPYMSGLRLKALDDGKVETEVLKACAVEQVACVSTRSAFIQDRITNKRFSRGFSNSSPDEGHWNRAGHEIMARIMWEQLQAQKDRP
ncbi:MAG TPA: hypothetical protein VM056_00800 [Terriglobales bacterium]|nr:hypothetical protein [Terriglobales bacterium]